MWPDHWHGLLCRLCQTVDSIKYLDVREYSRISVHVHIQTSSSLYSNVVQLVLRVSIHTQWCCVMDTGAEKENELMCLYPRHEVYGTTLQQVVLHLPLCWGCVMIFIVFVTPHERLAQVM